MQKKRVFAVLTLLLLLILLVNIPLSFYPLNRILLNFLGERLGAKITCRSLTINMMRSLSAKKVEALGKGGFGLMAETAVVDYDLISLITGRLHLRCSLEDVRFYKGGAIINSLTDMLQIRPLGNLTFGTVSADFHIGKNDTLTRGLTLLNDKIKIFGNAITDKANNIRCFLYLFLKDDITKEIPKELRNSLLHKEEGPWSSISLGVIGNYEKPVLRIMTKHFRMNILSD